MNKMNPIPVSRSFSLTSIAGIVLFLCSILLAFLPAANAQEAKSTAVTPSHQLIQKVLLQKSKYFTSERLTFSNGENLEKLHNQRSTQTSAGIRSRAFDG